jgi:hypothetical protein
MRLDVIACDRLELDDMATPSGPAGAIKVIVHGMLNDQPSPLQGASSQVPAETRFSLPS